MEIRTENGLIPEAGLSEKLDQLEMLCAEVFQAVYDKPAKAPQIRKFMEYYLPTTLKMVKSYRVLGERNASGEEVAAARKRIDEALAVVLKGCRKMLDNLYRDDVLDITTDIDVLEQMLRRDGLTESELSMAAAQAKRAAEIDNSLENAMAKQRQEQTASAAQAADGWQVGDGTDVARRVEAAQEQAENHVPQSPVLRAEGTAQGQATAQMPQENQ